MKRMIICLCVAMLFTGVFSASASSKETQTEVWVTISDGTLRLTREKIEVTDIDGDGAITVNDVLYIAHEKKFPGGAAAGYGCGESDYGLSLTMLWGVESGAYGYSINNTSASSLADTVKNGDSLYAFVYTDLNTFSDKFSYFDVETVSVGAGEAFTLTLFSMYYDESWNTVVSPVSGANLIIDGKETDYKTDNEGKVTLTADKAHSGIISAKSDTETLVPPVCVVTVKASPASMLYIVIPAVIVVCIVVLLLFKRKKCEKN